MRSELLRLVLIPAYITKYLGDIRGNKSEFGRYGKSSKYRTILEQCTDIRVVQQLCA
jgi:hypothetical protein